MAVEQITSVTTSGLACRTVSDGPSTINLADQVVVPRPFDTFVNAIAELIRLPKRQIKTSP